MNTLIQSQEQMQTFFFISSLGFISLWILVAIFLFGGEVIRSFAFALLIGIVIGTYSSICIATPIVIDFDRKKKTVAQ